MDRIHEEELREIVYHWGLSVLWVVTLSQERQVSCFLFWVQLGLPYGAGGKEAEGLSEGSEDHLPKKKKNHCSLKILQRSETFSTKRGNSRQGGNSPLEKQTSK